MKNQSKFFVITSIAYDPVYHDRIKHMNFKGLYIKEKLDGKILSTLYINTAEQCVDIFAKGFPSKLFSELCSKLEMSSIHSYT